MLKNDEIRAIADKHSLDRGEIYDIRSQFEAMCQLSREAEQREQDWDDNMDADQPKKQKRLHLERQGNDGISLSFFKSNCSFLSGCLPQIVERILVAHGLDIESSNAMISWNTYLELYCIFEAGKMEKQSLIKFWIKFFDKGLRERVPEEDYMPVLEELVRGTTLREPNKTT